MKGYLFKKINILRRFWLYKILKKETAGVRVAIIDSKKIFLIKHPYDNFWVFPGGAIKKNEGYLDAARREIEEETRYYIPAKIGVEKFGKYENKINGKMDTVYFFVSKSFVLNQKRKSLIDKFEIESSGWFWLDDLPPLSTATERRINEIFYEKPKSKFW